MCSRSPFLHMHKKSFIDSDKIVSQIIEGPYSPCVEKTNFSSDIILDWFPAAVIFEALDNDEPLECHPNKFLPVIIVD